MRNITLSVPDDLLRRAKWLAVQQETSVSKLLTGYLERVVAQHDEYERAKGRALDQLREGFPVGDAGNFYDWSRDDLHARRGA